MHGIPSQSVAVLSAARRLALAAVLAASASACEMTSPSAPSGRTGVASALESEAPAFSAELAFCADEINRYRAGVGRSRLTRSETLEAFAAAAAENDGTSYIAHQFFKSRNGGGIVMAETEILWWRGFSVRTVIEKGLAQMWQVGPRGEHYEILVGPYSEVGCGVFVNGPEVTVTQSFR